eukprot:gene11473-11569_t
MYAFTINCEGDAAANLKTLMVVIEQTDNEVHKHVSSIESKFEGMGERIKDIFGELKGIIAGGLIAGSIFTGFEFLKDSTKEFNDLKESITRVNTVLASTNYAAGIGGDALSDQAKEMSDHIGPIFEEAMESVADFSTFFKTDMTNAALMVGKAVNDPIKGYSRLQRMGVTFSDEQKKQISNYETQGNLLKAQEVILSELKKEFGGQAAAFALTDAGKIAQDKKQWEDLKKYDLISLGLRVIPMFVIYKGLQTSIAIATGINAAAQTLLGRSMGEVAVGTAEATAAAEAFSSAFSVTLLGAISAGLGYLLEKMISVNQEMENATNKLSHLRENKDKFTSLSNNYEDIKNAYSNYGNLSNSQKSQLAEQIRELKSNASDYLQLKLNPTIAKTDSLMNNRHLATDTLKGGLGNLIAHTDTLKHFKGVIQSFDEGLKPITDRLAKDKVKMPHVYSNPGDGAKENAYSTSQLAGASGGLGSAHNVHIHIDTVQKIEDLAPLYDLVDQANELIRQINEFDVEFEDEPVKKKEPEQPQPIVTTQLVYRTMNRKNLG